MRRKKETMKHLYTLTPNQRHPKPKLPADPFYAPVEPDRYSTPREDAIFFAICGIFLAIEITACCIGYHILCVKGLL